MASHFLIEMMELNMANAYKNDSPHVDYVRMVKDTEEIEKMQVSSTMNDKAIGIIIDKIKIGVSELEIVEENKSLYGEHFIHRTGHCIGMSTHEFGDISAIHHAELKEGMIFSIETGIYLTGHVLGYVLRI